MNIQVHWDTPLLAAELFIKVNKIAFKDNKLKKTKGQIEAEISTAMTKFEKEHLGRGPIEANTYILDDMILIRLKGVLTPAEERLSKDGEGAQIIKQIRRRLIESSRSLLEEIIKNITGVDIKSLHTDISSRTGERIFVFCLSEKFEIKMEK